MNFKSCHIIGTNIDETYFLLLRELAQKGRTYKITKGSMAGDTRLEFDSVSGTIMEPIQYSESGERCPLAVTVPAGCPQPTTEKAIYEYFNNYILNSKLEPQEHYRYATWIKGGFYKFPKIEFEALSAKQWGINKEKTTVKVPDQLEWCIKHFCEITTENELNFGNNHCTISVGYPESNLAYDTPYQNEMERGTSPCLRVIDMKIMREEDKNNQSKYHLVFYVYFRSWDAMNGWPENNGGLILLQEYVANEIYARTGIEINVGPFNFFSKGLHVYGSYLEAMKIKVGASAFERVNKIKHNHNCYCGTGTKAPHKIGENGCIRTMCDPPILKEGETIEYPYKQQRGYHQHECGCWSRSPDSVNSLEFD